MVAAMVVPQGARVATRGAIVEEAGVAHVVKALVVEEDSDCSAELGGVQAFDLDPELLFLAKGELVNHHHLAKDPRHLADDSLGPSNVRETGDKNPGRVQDRHRLRVEDQLGDVEDELVEGEGDVATARGIAMAESIGEDHNEDVPGRRSDEPVSLAPVEVDELNLDHLRGGHPIHHYDNRLQGGRP